MNTDDLLKIFEAASEEEMVHSMSKKLTDDIISQLPSNANITVDTAKLIGAAAGIVLATSLGNTIKIINYAIENKQL